MGFSQIPVNINPKLFYIGTDPEFLNIKATESFLNIETTMAFLQTNYLNKNFKGQTLVLSKKSSSPAGLHLRFNHQFKGMPVYQSFIQASYTREGKLYSVIDALVKFETFNDGASNVSPQFWVNTNIGLIAAFKTFKYDSITNQPFTQIYTTDGVLVHSYCSRLYLNNPDSMVTAMVYLPNPIVAANTTYGGNYMDKNDQNNNELTNVRSKVRVPLRFENGKFILTDGIITLKNLHDPAIAPVEPTDTFINYTRDQSGFEDINVFYHLKTYSDYIRNIGFSDMLDSIYVDSHGVSGSDDSFFEPDSFPYEIEYGTGNVDDGEDGQVIIHEFGHSLSVIGAPSTVQGSQRIAMEEGQADYLAMSYSRSLSNNLPNDVFSWDGHNEFWAGFVTNTKRKYKDLTGVKDIDREVWSTALICIFDKLGRNKSDSIILSYYFHQAGGSSVTMPKMAGVILKMDSLLFNGINVAKIWQCFTDRGILDTVPWYLIKITQLINSSDIQIYNTSDFAKGIAPLRIISNNPHLWNEVEIYNNLGQKLNAFIAEKEILISPELFVPGVYYLKINSKDGQLFYTKKIIRF